MRWYFCLPSAVVWSICLLLTDRSFCLGQNASTEYQVKAAFLFNFAKFVDWPAHAFPSAGSPFTICLVGDPFGETIEKTIQGETLDRRPMIARRITAGEDLRTCQMVYVSPAESKRFMEIISAVANAPILTVGESEDFINGGGMFRFVKTEGHIHFQINPDAAGRVSLRVSSRLLRLAEIVRPRERAGIR